MAVFKYRAVDFAGTKVDGIIKAKDRANAINSLRKNQLYIIFIDELKERKPSVFKSKTRIKVEELSLFSRQLSALVKAGIPLTKSLNILFSQIENRYFKEVISSLYTDIESGKSLSEALLEHPVVFPPLYINMVKAGELSGALEVILERLTAYLEDITKLNRKVRAAFIYPTVVLCFAFLITAVIFLKVIPSFRDIFDSLGAKLPIITLLVIKISDIFRRYFFIFITLAVIILFLAKRTMRLPTVHLMLDRLKLRIPIFAKIINRVIIARFSKTLSTLLKSGVSIVSALDTASKTAGNKMVELVLEKGRIQVSRGEKIADSLSESNIFPPLVISLIAVGEETGDLPGMLDKISFFYDEEVNVMVNSLTSLLEPFIIIFLGVIIGGIVFAMFLPILQITQVIGR